MSTLPEYKIIAAEKQSQRQSKIPKEWLLPQKYPGATNLMDVPLTCGILSDEECDITSDFDATALLQKLRYGTYSAEQVTVAFCKRAAIAHQLTNCLTEIFFDEAIQRARELDFERRTHPGKPPRSLHGLPISLKDSFQVAEYDTSTGIACFVNEPAEKHSGLAAMLLDLGAILYCKTNLPQSIMTGDSDNNVFGRTLNPRNTALTAGGSTGGEGALIALRGSILGVGTDIGGSIRVPAVCNGIYGFRPSVGLVPHSGVRDLTTPGTDGVRSSAGPMATSLRDVAMFMETTMRTETWRYDSAVASIPWRNFTRTKRLRVGLALDDGMYTPTPPVRRGLQEVADLLQKNDDVEIIPLTLPSVKDIYADLIRYFTLSGSEPYASLFALTSEPLVPSLTALNLLSAPRASLTEFFALNVRRRAAAQQYLELFSDNDIDAILMPPAPHTALPLDKWTNASYTGLWNYLDYPAVVLPVGVVEERDTVDEVERAVFGDGDRKLYGLYTGPAQYEDVPVCVQLVGYRYQDEALMHTAALVDSITNGGN